MADEHVHWTTFCLEAETFEPYGPYNGWLDVAVSSELARDEQERLLPMLGRRYWPTMIKLTYYEQRGIEPNTHEVSHDLFTVAGLTAELARELAAMLTRAADLAESIDRPCSEPTCGHWAPCDCGRVAA